MSRMCKKRLFKALQNACGGGNRACLVKAMFCLAFVGKATFYLWLIYAAAGGVANRGKDGKGKGDSHRIDCQDFDKRHFE